jgi:hypothetical protein
VTGKTEILYDFPQTLQLDSGMALEVAIDNLLPNPHSLAVQDHITISFDEI